MVGSRAVTALAGLAVSLLVSVAAWLYLDTLLVFLFVPLVPFLLGTAGRGAVEADTDTDADPGAHADITADVGAAEDRQSVLRCPACGFETRDPEFDYCPRDGRRLQRRD
jgi:hypothetical protein